ncbi:LytR C-terminal domain-containing protein [Ornithinimicrobium cavernae]|uniref:LytR C-terminal domain-containing protein n=1 Tax=Ornithinimicrobium cavernae TaxID=2666047 RepID=UPI0012B16AEB|nr:LytR C-terminal domain-containing protein [Ornithinimicrobium cavernae]
MSTAARRRRRRAALVLTALVALLAAVGLYAFAYYQGWLPGDGASGSDTDQVTATATAPALQPSDVTVNVYNASGAVGVAGRTSEALASRGYSIDAVDNAPAGTEAPQVAEIRHGPAGAEGARLLSSLFPEAVVVADEREDDEVDLYIGAEFEEIEPVATDDSATATE